jgi:hypothetical protein
MTVAATGPSPLRSGRRLWISWVLIVTAAEIAGFMAPAVAGALTVQASVVVTVLALLAAGAVEGTLLGWGQAMVLRRQLAGFPYQPWVVRTAGAAVVAYAIGLVPSVFVDVWRDWPAATRTVMAVVLGLILLNSIGVAQWTVLRRLQPRAGYWIGYNAAAWLAGLAAFTAFTTPLWQSGQPPVVTIVIGLAGAALMAATMAAITGLAVCRRLSQKH